MHLCIDVMKRDDLERTIIGKKHEGRYCQQVPTPLPAKLPEQEYKSDSTLGADQLHEEPLKTLATAIASFGTCLLAQNMGQRRPWTHCRVYAQQQDGGLRTSHS